MQASQQAAALIKQFEGLRTTAYLCPAGIWTIGYGTTRGVSKGDQITQARAEQLLQADLDAVAKQLTRLLDSRRIECTQNQFDALCSFVYNLGIGALSDSTLLKLMQAGDMKGAAEQFGRWVKAGGKALPGLAKRRAAERALFES